MKLWLAQRRRDAERPHPSHPRRVSRIPTAPAATGRNLGPSAPLRLCAKKHLTRNHSVTYGASVSASPPHQAVFDAIADPTRRDILAVLVEQPAGVEEIAARFPISRPAISR